MKSQTAFNHREKMKARIYDAYSSARISHFTLGQLLETLKTRVYNTPEYAKVPRWVREYLSGLSESLSQSLYRHDLTWVHIWGGIAYKGWDSCPEECKQAMRENRGNSAHVWTDALPAIKSFNTAQAGDLR